MKEQKDKDYYDYIKAQKKYLEEKAQRRESE